MNRRDAIRTAAAASAGLATGLATGASSVLAASTEPRPSRDRAPSGQPAPEILLQGGRVVNADGSRLADVRIVGERIAEIGSSLRAGPDARVVDAAGHLVMPGGIDPHAHLQGNFVDDLTTGTSGSRTAPSFSIGSP